MNRSIRGPCGMMSLAFLLALVCGAAAEETLFIGVRPSSTTPKTTAGPKKEWFNANLNERALHTEALAASRALATAKGVSSEIDDVREGVLRERERCIKEFIWMLNWKNCPDPIMRRGAVEGLGLCNPDPKVLGKPLATSAVYEPDAETRKVSIELIKMRKDSVSAKALLDTWKSAFDDVGVLAANEATRKAAVDTIREVGDKRVFQAMLYYAMLEVRAGSAAPVRVDSVAIKGPGVNLPIDLPVLDLMGVEGTIVIPAMASLKQATGQDFGRHFDKWKEWIGKLP